MNLLHFLNSRLTSIYLYQNALITYLEEHVYFFSTLYIFFIYCRFSLDPTIGHGTASIYPPFHAKDFPSLSWSPFQTFWKTWALILSTLSYIFRDLFLLGIVFDLFPREKGLMCPK